MEYGLWIMDYGLWFMDYDLCIMATGFESNIPFLNFREIPNLYKRIIHPDLPNCCFIGFAPSFNWIQVS